MACCSKKIIISQKPKPQSKPIRFKARQSKNIKPATELEKYRGK